MLSSWKGTRHGTFGLLDAPRTEWPSSGLSALGRWADWGRGVSVTTNTRLELTWPNKDKFLLAPEGVDGKPVWVERDHPAAHEVRLTEFTDTVGEVDDTDPYAGNLLFTGDSLDVLRILCEVPEYRRHYRGKVKLIYIDPPFAGPDMLGSEEQVLLVTSEEPDSTLELLDTLEEPGSPIKAVVSVSMLKEGWDVKNIYVIAAVRAMESQLLTEQILGRGLRLPFGHRTGVGILDTVEVISHHAFSTLLQDAQALLQRTLGERSAEATATTEQAPGVIDTANIPIGSLPTTGSGTGQRERVVISLPGATPVDIAPLSDPQNPTLFDGLDVDFGGNTHTAVIIATVEERGAEGQATAAAVGTPLMPRQPNGVRLPVFIPRVMVRWVRDPFSLTSISADSVEALGQRWADSDAPPLIRKSLNATRDEAGETQVDIHDETDIDVAATRQLLAFESIPRDITQRLLNTNAVEASLPERNAATNLAEAFVRGAGVTEDTPWSKEHAPRHGSSRALDSGQANLQSGPARC